MDRLWHFFGTPWHIFIWCCSVKHLVLIWLTNACQTLQFLGPQPHVLHRWGLRGLWGLQNPAHALTCPVVWSEHQRCSSKGVIIDTDKFDTADAVFLHYQLPSDRPLAAWVDLAAFEHVDMLELNMYITFSGHQLRRNMTPHSDSFYCFWQKPLR